MKVSAYGLVFVSLFAFSGCTPFNNSLKIDDTSAYLSTAIGSTSFGGKVFCAYDVLGERVSGDKLTRYLWVLCQEYYTVNGVLKKGTEKSTPVVLELTKIGNDYRTSRVTVSASSVGQNLIPSELRRRLTETDSFDQPIFSMERLEADTLAQAVSYFEVSNGQK